MTNAVVALDAMGGDHAPDAIVAGALKAHDEHGVEVLLVGRPEVVASALAACGRPDGLPVIPAADVVGMDEDPALALRVKRDASVRVAADLVARGDAGALLSAGSTGATLAAALFAFGRCPGIRRPAVGAVIPLPAGQVVLVDAGGSSEAQPETLLAYARMGGAYARALGVAAPRVGLLNIGAEPGKGNALAKAAFTELDGLTAPLSFAGNVEPPAVLSGAVDVVVTDGFTGNIFLKTVEALSGAAATREIGGAGAGAAVVLGVAGDALVAHGGADADEIAAALVTAGRVAAGGLAAQVAAALSAEVHQ